MPAQKCKAADGLEQGSGGLCVFQVHKLPQHIRHDAERVGVHLSAASCLPAYEQFQQGARQIARRPAIARCTVNSVASHNFYSKCVQRSILWLMQPALI